MAHSLSKLTKYKLLTGSSALTSSLPATRSMSKSNFWSMLDRYGKIIVKPSFGSGGVGVMQVLSVGGGKYEVQYGVMKKTIKGRNALLTFIQRKTKGTSHIAQRRIPLARVSGRPFDVRVMVQRRKGKSWAVTGKLAKIAGSGYIVTNVRRSKGRVVTLPEAIRQSNIRTRSVSRIQTRLNQISLGAVKQLRKYYRIHTVGLDVGLDSKGKPWIIEANFRPSKELFLKLRDKSIYRRIMSVYRHHS